MSAISFPLGTAPASYPAEALTKSVVRERLFPLLPSRADKREWLLPFWIAVGLHVVLLLVGYLRPHDTLLDLIAKGEVEAVAPVDQQPQQEVYLVDNNPPPPPEANPEFVKPQEVVKVPPPPVLKPLSPPQVQPKPVEQAVKFAPVSVVIGDRNFPKPPYPYEAKLKHFQGTVEVALNVVAGQIVSAEVASSSGYGVLDSTAVNWIRQRWHFPTEITRNLSQPIAFHLAE